MLSNLQILRRDLGQTGCKKMMRRQDMISQMELNEYKHKYDLANQQYDILRNIPTIQKVTQATAEGQDQHDF